jgi:uncharacterized membrane protein YbhN (UPF0104 family)
MMVRSCAESKSGLSRSWIGYGIVLGFAILCGYYLVAHRGDFAFVAAMSLPEVAAASVLILLTYLINAYQLSLFLKNFGLSPGHGEMVAITAAMLLGNLVLPMRGGSAALAVYLKKVHRLDYQAFAAIYGGTAVLIALINTGLAMLGLVVLVWSHGFVHTGLSLFVVLLFAGSVYLSIFPPPVAWEGRGLFAPILEAAHSWHVLTRNRRLLALQVVTILAISLVMAGAFSFIYSALGMPLSLSAALITSSMGNVAGLVPITPGGLGIVDAVVVQIPQIYGLDAARSLAAALVFRVLSFAWACALGIPGMIYAFHASRAAEAHDHSPRALEDGARQ